MAVSAQADGLLPLDQHAMMICGDCAYHDYEGIALDLDERDRLVHDLGADKHVMMLRNPRHAGAGQHLRRRFPAHVLPGAACSMQVRALAGGTKPNWPNQGVPEKTGMQGAMAFNGLVGPLAWPALLRKLDRTDSSYRH